MNFLVFNTSEDILSRPVAFLFLILLRFMSSFSWVNCPSLMSWSLLIIFVIGLSLTFGDFSNSCSFHICISSSWFKAFCLALEVLFPLRNSFTVSHTIRDCLSFIKFQILLIWRWMCSICSFCYALINSLFNSLSFWVLAFVGFFLLHRGAVFRLSHFFLNCSYLSWTSMFGS